MAAQRERERAAAPRPYGGARADRLVLHRAAEERRAPERRSFGPGITGPLALACVYLLGGLLTLVALLLPGWSDLDVPGVLSVGLATGASGLLVLCLRSYLSTGSCQVLVALGSLLIGASMVAGGGGALTATFGVYYVLVAVYAALFFPPLPALGQVSWAGTVHVVALVLVEEPFMPSQTAVLFGTAAGTALVVGALVRQVRVVAATDELTGLANRRSFDEHVRMVLARASRTERPLTLLALDLDGFKQVNDTQGHAAGDRLLVASSRAWQRVLRDGELLARAGGDEFLVLLPETGPDGAGHVVDRLERATPAPLGVSIGLSVAAPGDTADLLLRRADRDLYRQKSRRR